MSRLKVLLNILKDSDFSRGTNTIMIRADYAREIAEALDTADSKLEAAKQRELELLAVIETMRKSVGMVISAVDGGVTHMIKDSLGETLLKEAFALSEEPSKALREHEAKVKNGK